MNHLNHLGIIMDGNGRWANLRGHPRSYGHIKGARIAKKIISTSAELGIKYLTLYAFSSENWLRPKQEVSFLMNLLDRYLNRELETLIKENIRLTTIGDLEKLPLRVQQTVQKCVQGTANCSGMNLVFALSYGSKQEIIETSKRLAQKVLEGKIEVTSIDEKLFDSYLNTNPAPEVDLIIRTSGEKRLSNFLLWQSAYAELEFTKTLWPDFTQEEFLKIISDYCQRGRRFGRVESTTESPRDEDLSY